MPSKIWVSFKLITKPLIIIILLLGCTPKDEGISKTINSSGIVIEKTIEESQSEAEKFIIFLTVNENGLKHREKIEVSNNNVWNLIEIDHTYRISYDVSANKNPNPLLQKIKHIDLDKEELKKFTQ